LSAISVSLSDDARPARTAVDVIGRPLGSGIRLQKAGLLFTAKPDINTWEKIGADLLSFSNASTWWIADWLVYGETTYQDRYKEAVKHTALSYQTLRNYTWVARRFPLSRRVPALSFSHHLEVVSLDQPQQDYWLRQAAKQQWSRNRLRTEVRNGLLTQQGEPHLLHLRLSADDLADLERVAGRERTEVETWARKMLLLAAAED